MYYKSVPDVNKGVGVKKSENFADVNYGSSLSFAFSTAVPVLCGLGMRFPRCFTHSAAALSCGQSIRKAQQKSSYFNIMRSTGGGSQRGNTPKSRMRAKKSKKNLALNAKRYSLFVVVPLGIKLTP